ncbi:MAG: MBL fold metallo-hydrolase [Deltaproteobacteria bacterium]|jgi:hydroxyacylglutathione hydrolase|nr:MBL fold metallo-hydrolase [Deltaproteobacteria bacterium]
MVLKTYVVGQLGANCFYYQKNDLGFIIDPGGSTAELEEICSNLPGEVDYILLTHGHVDHIQGVDGVKKVFPKAKTVINEEDLEIYEKAEIQAALFGLQFEQISSPDLILKKEQKEFHVFEIIPCPGHTMGGLSFYDKQEQILFSGDTLFRMSVGRTDFHNSSTYALEETIRSRLYKLPDETRVYPGHGPATTIGFEKKHNMVFPAHGHF